MAFEDRIDPELRDGMVIYEPLGFEARDLSGDTLATMRRPPAGPPIRRRDRHAAGPDVDPRRRDDLIAVGGASAGGGLAAGTVLMARDRRGPDVAFQLLVYPMLDDRDATPSAEEFGGILSWSREHNELETFRDEDIDYAARLLRAGVPTQLHVYPGAYHACDVGAPQARASVRMAEERMEALRGALQPQTAAPA